MDCRAARLLLSFPPDGTNAPAGPDAAALSDHLAVCPDCDAVARADARLDAHLGRAMHDLPVPGGLKDRILARLAAERADAAVRRKRLLGSLLAAAAAAAVLLVTGFGLWLARLKPDMTLSDIHVAWHVALPTNAEAVEAEFRAMGYRGCAPDFLNYAFPCMLGEGPVPGFPHRKAPRMMFVGPRGEHAIVIAVNPRQLQEVTEPPEVGYKYRIDVQPEGRWTYLVLYTGDNWNWLRAPAE
ncbi:MAG: hypothetical protein ACRC33_29635 [Gemmataceae bacterium]